jgi:hypothetical protein
VILTGDRLDEICLAGWGAFWKTVLAPRLGTTRQRLHRLSQCPTGHGKEIKRQLLALLEDHIALLCRYAQELRDDLM